MDVLQSDLIRMHGNNSLFLKHGFLLGTWLSIGVSFAKSPSEFYIQRVSDADRLRELQLRLYECCDGGKYGGSKEPDKLMAGKVYAARYSADKQWYRARIRTITLIELRGLSLLAVATCSSPIAFAILPILFISRYSPLLYEE